MISFLLVILTIFVYTELLREVKNALSFTVNGTKKETLLVYEVTFVTLQVSVLILYFMLLQSFTFSAYALEYRSMFFKTFETTLVLFSLILGSLEVSCAESNFSEK